MSCSPLYILAKPKEVNFFFWFGEAMSEADAIFSKQQGAYFSLLRASSEAIAELKAND